MEEAGRKIIEGEGGRNKGNRDGIWETEERV